MARNKQLSVANFDNGIATGTKFRVVVHSKEYVQILADMWEEFDADNAAWRLANDGQADPFPCFVTTGNAATRDERFFIEVRMQVENDLDGSIIEENSAWKQINSTNYVGTASLNGDLVKVAEVERTRHNLVPAA